MLCNRWRSFRWIALAMLAAMTAARASAKDVVDPPASLTTVALPTTGRVTELQGVSVTGVQPGPGLWKISRNGHVLWVLGTLEVLPRSLSWQARDVQAAIADSQQVLDQPRVKLDARLGFFGTIGILPSLIGVRNNPDGKHLIDVVPAGQYAHWLVLKAKYLGHDGSVEKQRPIFAAFALFVAAIRDAGLVDGTIEPIIRKAARQRDLTPTPVTYTVTVNQPKAVVKDFKKGQLQDGDCFAKTLDHLQADVARMQARANAWASGDLDALRRLPLSDQLQVCLAAVDQSGMARELGLSSVEARLESTWVAAADTALSDNRVTFAQLPMARLLDQPGYLTGLQAQGATVTLPDGLTDDAPAPAGTVNAIHR